MSQKLETCIAQIGSKMEAQNKNGDAAPNNSDQNHSLEIEDLVLKDQIQQLQAQLKGATGKITIVQQPFKHNGVPNRRNGDLKTK